MAHIKVTREWIGHLSITSNPTFWSSLRTVESEPSAWSGGQGSDHRSLKSSPFPGCLSGIRAGGWLHGKTLVCKAEGQYLNSQDPQKNAVWVRHFPAVLAHASRGISGPAGFSEGLCLHTEVESNGEDPLPTSDFHKPLTMCPPDTPNQKNKFNIQDSWKTPLASHLILVDI